MVIIHVCYLCKLSYAVFILVVVDVEYNFADDIYAAHVWSAHNCFDEHWIFSIIIIR